MTRIAVALLVLLSARAGAADVDPARRGVYLGVGGTFAVYTEAQEVLEKRLAALGYLARVDVEAPLGFTARAGYRAHAHIAAEVEFEWLSSSDVDYDFDPPPQPAPPTTDRIDSWVLTANAKGYLLTGTYQPFLLAGVGLMRAELSGSAGEPTSMGLVARFGAGFDIYLTESLVANVSAGYVLPFGDVSDLDYGLVDWGLSWRF